MPHDSSPTPVNPWQALCEGASVAGRSDAQLLDDFAGQGGDQSERAFTALVERHGPLVLRTCRQVVGDEAGAHDAFQAVFLALARRAGSLRVGDSIGPWLHRVAVRAALRARRCNGSSRRT